VSFAIVTDFKFGIDRRRERVAGIPGTLWLGKNVLISRGGDVQRAKKMVSTYTLPANFARRVGASRASITVAGRNLGLWTNFPGNEPEASFNGGARGGSFGQWEQNVLPQLRQFVTTVNFNF
jgi:hypothetical protein